MKGLLTTTVGSFPKPDYIKSARAQYARKKVSRQELKDLELKATQKVIALQEEIGLDILVDGEMERGDMATFFAERMEGFEVSGFVRSYGNRYYQKPIVVGKVRRIAPITLEFFEYAQSLTDKPVKGMITGPYTIMDWSFDEYYDSRRDVALNIAEELHKEVEALEKAGAKYIQIDEPAISVIPEEFELAIETMKIMTDGIKAKTITHICYGNFEKIYPHLLELAVDQVDLEMTNSNYDLLELFRKHQFTKELAMGVLDVHSHVVEKKEDIVARIKKALGIIPPERLYIDPDCGLKTRTWEEARQKLEVMAEAVRAVKNDEAI